MVVNHRPSGLFYLFINYERLLMLSGDRDWFDNVEICIKIYRDLFRVLCHHAAGDYGRQNLENNFFSRYACSDNVEGFISPRQ